MHAHCASILHYKKLDTQITHINEINHCKSVLSSNREEIAIISAGKQNSRKETALAKGVQKAAEHTQTTCSGAEQPQRLGRADRLQQKREHEQIIHFSEMLLLDYLSLHFLVQLLFVSKGSPRGCS